MKGKRVSNAKELVENLAAAIASNDPDIAAARYADNCVIVDPKFDGHGRAFAREALAYHLDAFRYEKIEIREIIEQDNRVVVHWSWTAVHQGEYMGIEASGRRFDGWNVLLLHFKDGLIVRDLSLWDVTQYLSLKEAEAA